MPIEYKGKKYEFGNLVKKIKKSKPGIKSPGGYVKSIEQKQHLSQKIEKLKVAAGTPRVENGGDCPECTGKGKDYRNNCPTCEGTGKQMFKSNLKIRPPKPTQRDRTKIIQARLAILQEEIAERKIARLHDHRIVWRENPIGGTKVASLIDATGKFVKYWLLNAKEINGNGWGVSPISIAQNILKFKGKPFVVTAQTWIPNSEYGMEYRHPTIMSNDLGTIFRYQAKFAVGLIRDVYEEKDNWFATIEMNPKYANLALPPFCSPAIFQLDPFESDGSLTKWEALHLAGLVEKPAYGAQIALLKGTCIGTPDQCKIQFRGAQLKKKFDNPLKQALDIGIQKSPNVKINPMHGRTIADAYDQLKHNPNDPEVKKSYGAFIAETNEQFQNLLDKGLKIDKIGKDIKPYKSSEEMHRDIKRNHLSYFPTESGFGTGEAKGHPMLEPTKFIHEGKPLLANDVFRIVHDVMGHHVGGLSNFSPEGEHRAFLTHRKMYSDEAKKALFTDTAGQSNWINFSRKFGKKNRDNPARTVFPEQKAGILPMHIINGEFHES